MLVRKDVIFGMRHQTEHVALGIADACNVRDRTIRVIRICAVGGRAVTRGKNQSNLIARLQSIQRRGIRKRKITFSVRDWTIDEFCETACPYTSLRSRDECNPAAFEMSTRIERERRFDLTLSPSADRRGEKPRLHQCLKSVADANHRLAARHELVDLICKVHLKVQRQQFTRAQGIRVRKATR